MYSSWMTRRWPRWLWRASCGGAAILNLHERIENKLFLDRTRMDSNFKRPHICATLFQIEKYRRRHPVALGFQMPERLQGLGERRDLAAQAGYRVLRDRQIGSQSAALPQ